MAYRREVANDKLTSKINKLAVELHKEVGPHQPEHIYQEGLCLLMDDAGLEYECEVEFDIKLKGKPIGKGFADMLVEDQVVLELKAVKRTTDDHFNQLGRNVKALEATRGLLLNFGAATLYVQRYVNGYGKNAEGAGALKR